MRSYPQIPMEVNVMRKLAKETRGPGNTQVLETIGMHNAHCTYRKKRRVEHWDKVLVKFGNLLRYMKKWRDGNGIVQVF